MYQIDKDKNRINEVSKKTFSELGFKERDHFSLVSNFLLILNKLFQLKMLKIT